MLSKRSVTKTPFLVDIAQYWFRCRKR